MSRFLIICLFLIVGDFPARAQVAPSLDSVTRHFQGQQQFRFAGRDALVALEVGQDVRLLPGGGNGKVAASGERRESGWLYPWLSAAGVALLSAMVLAIYVSRNRAKMRDREKRLRHALEVGRMGTWERDLSRGKLIWNPRSCEIFGVPPAGPVDDGFFLSHIDGADLPAVQQALEATVRSGADHDFEFRFHRPDGRTVWVHSKGGLRHDHAGVPTHIAGIHIDLTERKAAEEALRELTEQLDQRVALRTQELAESQRRLRALVAEIAKAEERERHRLAVELHDHLAQMLTVSRLNIGRAAKLAADETLAQRLTEAQSSVDEAIAYTRSLMTQLSPRVLYELGFPAALAWLAGQQQERHGLRVDVAGVAQGFALDEERSVLAYQCVRELLWNIVKHAQAQRVVVDYAIAHGELSVEVSDDGQGFDPATLRGDGDGEEKFGLFSIRERLELSRGKLEVTSRPGGGTRARFTLAAPQCEMTPAAQPAAPLSRPALAAGQRLTVMLVDDHDVVRYGLRQIIEECADFTVIGEAQDGLAGVELARELRPDVVVMDVNMPRMNGIQATRLIRQEMPSTIVVGLSFDNGPEIAQKMLDAGAFTCVTKERAAEDIQQAILDAASARQGGATARTGLT